MSREREIKIKESQDTFWALQRRRVKRRVRSHPIASVAFLAGTLRLTSGGALEAIDESVDYKLEAGGTAVEFAIGDPDEMTTEQKEESALFGRIQYFGAVAVDIRDAQAGRDVDIFVQGTPAPHPEATPTSDVTPTP